MNFFVSCKTWKEHKWNSDLEKNRKSMRWIKCIAISTTTKWLTTKQQNENKENVMDQSEKLDNPTNMDDSSELCFPRDVHIK